MAALLDVRGLQVDFEADTGPVRVLNGMDLTVEAGQSVGVVGESGSGKTVLLRTILGLLQDRWRVGAGAFTVFVGLLTTSAGRRALLRHGTNVNPKQPTTVLVTEGVFARTRNPLYVGVSVALGGIALIFALDWLLLLIIPSCVILHFAVVRREELYLERKFGEAYRRYKARVPRYLLGY